PTAGAGVPARVYGRRPGGGRLGLLFVAPLGEDGGGGVLGRGARRRGGRVHLAGGQGEWVAPLGAGRWRLRLALDEPALAWLERVGEVPLPPYVRRAPTAADRERYQTVYARAPGALAAPTAGLHLTRELLGAIAAAGVRVATLTLHVGPGTFLPIRSDDLEQHVMAPEPSDIPPPTVEAIGAARAAGGRVVAVGTTTVGALESALPVRRSALRPGLVPRRPAHHRAGDSGQPGVPGRSDARGGERRGEQAARGAGGVSPSRQRPSSGAAARGQDVVGDVQGARV